MAVLAQALERDSTSLDGKICFKKKNTGKFSLSSYLIQFLHLFKIFKHDILVIACTFIYLDDFR